MLQIPDPRERTLVQAADAALGIVSGLARPFRRRSPVTNLERILLLRLERIGDLVMALPAIRDLRALAPAAEIDLVVGSWNAVLAGAAPWVTRVLTLDAEWLSRDGTGLRLPALLREARSWRSRKYDLAINFEPDIRSNLLVAAAGAAWTAGWASGGGAPVLDLALDYDPASHTSANARRLVAAVFGRTPEDSSRVRLALPESATRAALARLSSLSFATAKPLVGIHASGGRAIKQWDPERFGAVGARLADERDAVIVLTGGPGDRPLVDRVKSVLGSRPAIDLSGEMDLLVLAAVLERLTVFVTGDTGPMHIASAMGTPMVAVFGPSMPSRYAPTGALDRVVRVDLPCSPCNRIRRPPARCVGHTPDCLAGISADAVYDAAAVVLDASAARVTRAGRA